MRSGYAFVRWLSRTFFRVAYGLEVRGMEHLPRTGKVIIASNHRSNFDPPILGGTIPRETHFFAKAELFKTPILGALIRYLNAFPVKRRGFDRESLEKCLDVLEREQCLLFFPEGTRAPADGYLQAKLGVGWVVSLSRAPVVPVYIHGSRERRPQLRGRPGIIVMVGTPVSADDLLVKGLNGRALYQAAADRILEAIRELSLSTPYGKVKEKAPLYERNAVADERLR